MLLDFLKTKRSPEELKIAYEILMEFKEQESQAEWLHMSFVTWARLEQYQEYLQLLLDIDTDQVDDQVAKNFLKKHRNDH